MASGLAALPLQLAWVLAPFTDQLPECTFAETKNPNLPQNKHIVSVHPNPQIAKHQKYILVGTQHDRVWKLKIFGLFAFASWVKTHFCETFLQIETRLVQATYVVRFSNWLERVGFGWGTWLGWPTYMVATSLADQCKCVASRLLTDSWKISAVIGLDPTTPASSSARCSLFNPIYCHLLQSNWEVHSCVGKDCCHIFASCSSDVPQGPFHFLEYFLWRSSRVTMGLPDSSHTLLSWNKLK